MGSTIGSVVDVALAMDEGVATIAFEEAPVAAAIVDAARGAVVTAKGAFAPHDEVEARLTPRTSASLNARRGEVSWGMR